MGCGATVSKKRFEEVEVRAKQLQNTLQEQEAQLRRLEGAESSKSEDRSLCFKELEEERSGRSGAEDSLQKALAQIAALREEVTGLEEAASVEASRSSRLDGRCSALAAESKSLHDEISSFTESQQQWREAEEELRAELQKREEELTRLHQQVREVAEERADLQAQKDYACTELQAANQVAEALKTAGAAMEPPSDRRRKPRRSRGIDHETASQGSFVSESDAGGSVAASEVSKAEEIRPRKRESTKARRLSEKQDTPPAAATNVREEEEPKSHSSPQSFEVPIPDVPWTESPDQAPIKAFNFDKAVEGPLSPVQEEVPRATTRETGPPETSQEPPEEKAPQPSPEQGKAPAPAAPEPRTDPAAKVFQFDFSVFDFLKHEALQTPPDSPVPGLPPEAPSVTSHPVVFPPRSPEKAPEGTEAAARHSVLEDSPLPHGSTRSQDGADQVSGHTSPGAWGDASWGAAETADGRRWTARA